MLSSQRYKHTLLLPGVGLPLGDAVEKVGSWLRLKVLIEADARECRTSCHRRLPGEADFGELAQVLGGCGEMEFISGTIGSP